jgi:uncharacterized repeat protein (TIGR02543 family)
MRSSSTGRLARRRVLLTTLAGAVFMLAAAPGSQGGGLQGLPSQFVVAGSGTGSGNMTAIDTIYGGNFSSGTNCNWTGSQLQGICGDTVPKLEPPQPIIVLRATPQPNSNFTGWIVSPVDNIVQGCGAAPECWVSIDSDTRVTGNFVASPPQAVPQYAVTVLRQGPAASGRVGVVVTSTSSPPQTIQLDCGVACTTTFPENAEVTLTATVPAGVTFGGWSGPQAPSSCGTNISCTLTVAQVSTLIASFNVQTFPLAVTEVGQGGIISNVQPGIHCGDGGTDCTVAFASGAQIVLRATPDDGYRFQGWTGACSGTSTCTVTMSGAQNVTATFVSVAVQAALNRVGISYDGPRLRQRVVTITTNARQPVTVVVRVLRPGVQLTQARFSNTSGVRTARIYLRNTVRPGLASVRVTLRNQFGTLLQLPARSVRIGAVRR